MKKVTKKDYNKKKNISRRNFLASTAAGVAAFTIVPRHVLGGVAYAAPSDKLNIAGIGIGGMGKNNIERCAEENITALCDVDFDYAAQVFKKYPKAKTYKDYRIMLDKQKDIDAVVIATPDHSHAVIAMEAMRRGKHVYLQKPMTRTVYEARKLTEAARKYKVATQMGNQGHSGNDVRSICEWIWDGAIGQVREVHAWTNRPVWPQGIGRPKDKPSVPKNLDWDLWIGPSPKRPYHPAYHPFNWRGWWDFGCGALGDMACHVLDPVFFALKLGYPTSVEACTSKNNNRGSKEDTDKETFPLASMIHFEFDARDDMPPVTVHWYDGGLKPKRPPELDIRRPLDQANSNVLFIGDKGVLRCGEYGDNPQLIPYSRMREYKKPKQILPRIGMTHEEDWIRACKGGRPACSNFDYAGPFTEAVVMGNLAMRFPGQKLLWDGENMRMTNNNKANEYVNEPYRWGWSL